MKKTLLITIYCISMQMMAQGNKDSAAGIFMDKVEKSKKEWQTCLTPAEYKILREKGTERAFTGEFYNHKEVFPFHLLLILLVDYYQGNGPFHYHQVHDQNQLNYFYVFLE